MALDPVALARWKASAEVDYCEYFRKAYEPFNAWFKDVYGQSVRDSKAISQIKNGPNVVHREIVALLRDSTPDAIRSLDSIGSLHERLEAQTDFPVPTHRCPVTMRDCWIANNAHKDASTTHNRIHYHVKRGDPSGEQILCEVTTRRGCVFSLAQNQYDFTGLRAHPQHATITRSQRAKLEGLYQSINPREMKSLLDFRRRGNHIKAGTVRLRDDPEVIFAGLVEIIYCLRCLLVHGNIAPNTTHNEVYEPAYFILRRFLGCIV